MDVGHANAAVHLHHFVRDEMDRCPMRAPWRARPTRATSARPSSRAASAAATQLRVSSRSTSILPARCCSDWNEPISWPNCVRVFRVFGGDLESLCRRDRAFRRRARCARQSSTRSTKFLVTDQHSEHRSRRSKVISAAPRLSDGGERRAPLDTAGVRFDETTSCRAILAPSRDSTSRTIGGLAVRDVRLLSALSVTLSPTPLAASLRSSSARGAGPSSTASAAIAEPSAIFRQPSRASRSSSPFRGSTLTGADHGCGEQWRGRERATCTLQA